MSCPNRLRNGSLCGFTLPTGLSGSTTAFREKVNKHETAPVSGSTEKVRSWYPNSGEYTRQQVSVYCSGAAYVDLASNSPCFITPLMSGVEAKVAYPQSGTIREARYTKMVLNSLLPKMHHHAVEDISGLIPICSGMAVRVVLPPTSGQPYQFVVSGNLIATYDPVARALYRS
jgi:hypothetical protein